MPKPHPAPQAFAAHKRPPIDLHPVTSSQIHSVGYDEPTKTLAVRFHSSKDTVYHYPGVDKKAHGAFIGAKSLGSHFKQHLRHLKFDKFRADEAGTPASTRTSA